MSVDETTFVVDLNDVDNDGHLTISLNHVLDSDSPAAPVEPGETVHLYSGDEPALLLAIVRERYRDDPSRFVVEPKWNTMMAHVRADERVSLYGVDPLDALSAMLRTPKSDAD